QVESCRIEPLQIVEEQSKRMLGSCEHSDESPKDELESALCVLRWKVDDRRGFSDDQLQFRNKVDNELCVRTQRILKRIAPFAQLSLIFRQKRTQKALKRLCQSGIRDVALVLVEFTRCEQAARRNKHFVKLMDDGGLADAGISGNKNQLRSGACYNTVEGSNQGFDFGFSPV